MYKYKQNNYTMQLPHKNFSYVHDDKLKSYNEVVIILLLYIHERHVTSGGSMSSCLREKTRVSPFVM